jgi:hypothetical protein
MNTTTLGDLLKAAINPAATPLRKSPAPVTRPPTPQQAPLPKAALARGVIDLRKVKEARLRTAIAARMADVSKRSALVAAGIADIEGRLTKLEQRLKRQ